MSQAEAVPMTDAEEIKMLQREQNERIERVALALNDLGKNVQWIIDMASPLLEMMNSPMFGQMMPGVMAGAMGGLPDAPEG